VALPPTIPGPPNTVVQVQPGMNVQAVCLITPPAGALLTTAQGGRANTSVAVQPGMAVRAIVLVNSAGQFISL
jgi:hypothetical protein